MANLPRIRNAMNAHLFPLKKQIITQPSMTIPDESMSIREILDRFSRGLPVGGSRTPIYDDENDMPDIRTLDLAERQELAQHYSEELKSLTNPKKPVKKAEKPQKPDSEEPVDLGDPE